MVKFQLSLDLPLSRPFDGGSSFIHTKVKLQDY